MLIILEGCDGAGKTTLARQLAGWITTSYGGEVQILHRGPLTRHPVLEYELELQDYRPMAGRHLICDRWHLGELVYGPVLRGETRLDDVSLLHIELFLKARGALLVDVRQDLETLRARLAPRGDDLVSNGQLEQITAAYDQVMARSNTLPRLQLSGELTSSSIHDIVARARSTEYTSNRFEFSSYTGDPMSTSLLLVGEHLGGSAQGCTSAFVPLPSSSGHYLLEALLAAACLPGERCISLTNAGTDDARAQWEALGRPPVALLGGITRELVDFPKAGLVPHPQFVRRFLHRYKTQYGHLIWEAAITGKDLRKWQP